MKGLSLVELLIALSIFGTMAGLVMPAASLIYHRSEATTGINWIVGAVNYTRHAAVMKGVTATLCPSKDNKRCSGEWHEGLMVFADHNQDGKLNDKDFIIENIRGNGIKGTVRWRSFRNRQYLQFTAMGYTNFQNGNFVYCPSDQNLKFARQIVINMQGRARLVHTRNGAGEYIDRYGKTLKC